MVQAKLFRVDLNELQKRIKFLSKIENGLSKMLVCWDKMSESEQIYYVAKRYLSTGYLKFNPEWAEIYCLETEKKLEIEQNF